MNTTPFSASLTDAEIEACQNLLDCKAKQDHLWLEHLAQGPVPDDGDFKRVAACFFQLRRERGEATAEIARLRGSVDLLDTMFAETCDEIGCECDNEAALLAVHAMKEEIARLRAALEPFAKAGDKIAIGMHDNTTINNPLAHGAANKLTALHLREARAALGKDTPDV